MSVRGGFVGGVMSAVLACATSSEKSARERHASSDLPAGIVAVVGAVPVTEERVVAVGRAQDLAASEAAGCEMRDVLFASGAMAEGYDDAPMVRAAVRGRLSRAVLAELYARANQTEPNDQEVAEATARHFVELDRPEAFRVIHAVVRVPERAEQAALSRARSLAERIAERVATAVSAEDFRREAESAGEGEPHAVVEVLKPVAADGRVVDIENPMGPPERYAGPFAHAASRLSEPGQKSSVVATEFGFHVLMLLDRLPAHVLPLEERRNTLRAEIVTERAKKQRDELVARLRAASAPVVERSAESLIVTLDVGGAAHEAR